MATLSETLKEILETKGITLEKLSESTDIPKRYLDALINGDLTKLPPAPYVRGYLIKIAKALRINNEELWQNYKNEVSLKTSGQNDKLSINRYAFPAHHNKKTILCIIVLISVIIYLSFRWNNIFGSPTLEIINPAIVEVTVKDSIIKVSGRVDPKDKLIIDTKEVVADPTGWFEKDMSLQPGPNTIIFTVKKFLGKEIEIIRQINYQP